MYFRETVRILSETALFASATLFLLVILPLIIISCNTEKCKNNFAKRKILNDIEWGWKRSFAQKRYRPRIFFIRNLRNSIFFCKKQRVCKDLIYLLLQGFTERRFIGRIKTFYKPKQKIKSSFYTLCHTDLREFCFQPIRGSRIWMG